ncbi:MAG: AsmA family protein [Sphingomonadales bacterium]
MRKILIGLAIVIVPLLAAALIGPSFIDWNRFKTEIAEGARDMTGRDVAIDGSIAFSILPAPALSVNQVRLANLPGANSVDMLALKSLEVRVAFLPLLRGQIRIEKVVLIEPEIELEILADGRRNWSFGDPGGQAVPKDQTPALSSELADIQLDSFVVRNGRITVRESAKNRTVTVENLDATITARSLRGPVQVNGVLDYQGLPMGFELTAGQISDSRPIPIDLALTVKPSDVAVKFSGAVKSYRPDDQLTGKFSLTGSDLAAALSDYAHASGDAGGAQWQAPLDRPFKVDATIGVAETDARLDDVELRLGQDGEQFSARGSAVVTFDEVTGVDARLAINRLNLDTLLTAPAEEPSAASDVAPGRAGGSPNRPAEPAPATTSGGFALPTDIKSKLDLTVAALTYRGSVVRQIRVAAELDRGVVDLKWATAQLPGSSDVSVTGALTASEGTPRFDGKVRAASNNLRALLGWLDLDQATVPPDRLTKVALSGTLTATNDVVQLYGIEMGLDASRVTGGMAIALRTRPSFSVDLEVDRLNLDGYLAPRRHAEETGANGKPLVVGEVNGPAGLASLDDFDTNIKLRAGNMTYRKTRLEDVNVDASLVGGVLTMRNFSARGRSRTRIALTGSATNFAAKPSITGEIDLASDNLAVVQRLLGVSAPLPLADLGRAAIKAQIDGSFDDQLGVDVDLKLAATRIRAAGKVSNLAVSPRFNLTVDASNDSLAAVVRQFNIEKKPPVAGFDKPVALKGTVNGNLGSLDVNVALAVAGGRLTVAGKLAPTALEPTYDLNLGVQHNSLVAFVRGLGFDYKPASARLGGIELATHVQGGPAAIVLSDISGNIGPASLEGDANYRLEGAKPKLTARIAAGEIVPDFFMEPRISGARQARAAASADARWSQRLIEVGFLSEIDADIDLKARRIAYGPYEFVVPELEVRLADGTLELTRLSGKLFGGDVTIAAEVKNTSSPEIVVDMTLRNASVQKALRASADLTMATGVFDMTGSFRTSGDSQFEMVSRLQGEANINARDGVIRGVDLRRLNDGLGTTQNRGEVIGLIRNSLGGGETAYSSVTGKMVVTGGVARTRDVAVNIDAADTAINAVVDLPKWWIESESRFRLVDHPNMPPLGLDIRGPLNDPVKTVLNRDFVAVMIKRLGAAALRKVFKQPNGGLKELLGIGGQPESQPNAADSSAPETPAPTGAAPTTPPEPPKPAEQLLKSLLDSLAPPPADDKED